MAASKAARARDAARSFLGEDLGLSRAAIETGGLVTRGLLDSAALVRLAAVLEDACEVTIPDRDLVVEHFDSLDAIEAYVARLAR